MPRRGRGRGEQSRGRQGRTGIQAERVLPMTHNEPATDDAHFHKEPHEITSHSLYRRVSMLLSSILPKSFSFQASADQHATETAYSL